MLAEEGAARRATTDPLAPKKPHFEPTAKRVIFLFMSGGPSHVDTFDPKPELTRLHGQKLPASFGPVKTRRGVDKNKLLASKRTFKKHGQSRHRGVRLVPAHRPACIDDICVLRGCYGDSVTHPESVYLMNTGSILMGRPSLGAWVELRPGHREPEHAGVRRPARPRRLAEGRRARPGATASCRPRTRAPSFAAAQSPIAHLPNPAGRLRPSSSGARSTSSPSSTANTSPHRGDDSELAARIAAYELAFRMQAHAPEVVDLAKETDETKRLYGLDRKETAEFGTRCLLARRMVERGVRFVQVYCGDTNGWDAHSDLEGNHGKLCLQSDKPIAGLLTDLKRRGLLEATRW